jgi:hypothetical protein
MLRRPADQPARTCFVRGLVLRLGAVLITLLACGVAPATAARGLFVGVDDDALKWTADPEPLLKLYSDLGLKAVRIVFPWKPGESTLTLEERALIDRIDIVAPRTRVVLQVWGGGRVAPRTATARADYCSYVGEIVRDHPLIQDIVIWMEANQPTFFRPPDAPAYVALLARCWDTLHAIRPDVNVIASTGPHQRIMGAVGPATWYRRMGDAYRKSHRTRRLFDTLGHNIYPDSPLEAPSTLHKGPSIDQGDLPKLLAALKTAFARTAQPQPGKGGVRIWYLEDGYQSIVVDRKEEAYTGAENEARPLTVAQQGKQLAASVRLAYCQPYVGAFFNFLVVDDGDLVGWQSGVVYADGTPKASYFPFQTAIAEVNSESVVCPKAKPVPRSRGKPRPRKP